MSTPRESASARVAPLAFLARAVRLAWAAFTEGRLSVSPRRWLADLRHLHGVMSGRHAAPVPINPPRSHQIDSQRLPERVREELEVFLRSGARIAFASQTTPEISIILVLWNRAELTLRCLRSLENCSASIEVVIVDNASTDETSRLLDALDNVVIVRNGRNEGFARGVNAGADKATGEFLLLLNNDAELLPGSLEAALAAARATPNIGAVGGKLIVPDGRLQEAGSIVWDDGSCTGYGRGDDPFAPAYMFRRDVSFASGALLLTPRAQFAAMSGLDADFSPAYYEDVDYCVRLWRAGLRVVFEPFTAAMHREFSTTGSADKAFALQRQHRTLFLEKQGDWIRANAPSAVETPLAARSQSHRRRLLFLEDRVPHPRLGAGYPRANEMLRAMRALGYDITFYPMVVPSESWEEAYADVPREVELMLGLGANGLAGFLRDRATFYDVMVVSRPHNMRELREAMPTWPAGRRPRLVYDAEAIFALREASRRRLNGVVQDRAEVDRLVADETSLASGCDVILTVSDLERDRFRAHGHRSVLTLGHSMTVSPGAAGFADRHGLLFVGAVSDDTSPNADSLNWLIREVLPELRATIDDPPLIKFVGRCEAPRTAELAAPGFERVGMVADVRPYFESARIFVAPTRFGAGISLKVLQAAAFGLPIVCSSLVVSQLGWQDGKELLVADRPADFIDQCRRLYADERLWTDLRKAALTRVQAQCAPETFTRTLAVALKAPDANDRQVRDRSPS